MAEAAGVAEAAEELGAGWVEEFGKRVVVGSPDIVAGDIGRFDNLEPDSMAELAADIDAADTADTAAASSDTVEVDESKCHMVD